MTNLRAVAPNEKPPVRKHRRKIMTVAQAALDGDQYDQLVAMRSRIAQAIDEPEIRGADLAALTRRLLEVGKEIETINAREAEDAAEAAISADEDWVAI